MLSRAVEGPDSLDNGLALCVLHHKLFDLGVMGLDDQLQIRLSEVFTARTSMGRAQYDLHGRNLQPRPGTLLPATVHVDWHNREVFKGTPLIAKRNSQDLWIGVSRDLLITTL